MKWVDCEQLKRVNHYEKSVEEKTHYKFSGLCPSMDGQRLLTIVDTAEKLWLEYSENL